MKKIVSPEHGPDINGPTNQNEHLGGQPTWFVNGEAYVADNHPYVSYAQGVAGYVITTVASAPQPYLDAVAAMSSPNTARRIATALRDSAVDPHGADNFVRPK